jgi:HSP90 family molecular chaperone
MRELIQNSIDACLLRAALEKSWGNRYTPEIKIRYSAEENGSVLEIADNGTGMDQHIIDSYYSQIGTSFYKSAEFYDMKSQSNANFTPTSRFGIGILSCFMVADSMAVETRRVYAPHASSEPIELSIEGHESIFWIKSGSRSTPGTTTRLFLRKNKNPWKEMDEDSFISAVESVVPNPPFKIAIETASKKRIRDQRSFRVLKASSLKDYSWQPNQNIKELSFELTDRKKGFVGSVIVALLERRGSPVTSVAMRSRTVTIDSETYKLEKSISLNGHEIDLHTSTITVDEDGCVEQSESSSNLAKSRSRVSLHGIEVPTTLFPDSWDVQNNQVRLMWPFPVLLVIDICGSLDLELNSSRTQILQGEKWAVFEDALAIEICSKIASAVSATYWKKLYKVLSESSRNLRFLRCVKEVNEKTSGRGRIRRRPER